ncbi:MAG TPA: phytanoyl-CoA dioxygenase family protein [Terriglobales bacterium]|nr:phytanoyl-CoA dioxygenase family protein [Terriglobales bacterium]
MPASPDFLKTIAQLKEQATLPADALQHRLQQSLDPNYWTGILPGMTIGVPLAAPREESGDADQRLQLSEQQLRQHGYFNTPAVFSSEATARLRQAVLTLIEQDWPPAFVFVFDQFWNLFRGPQVDSFIQGIVGAGYRQVPYVWAHYVSGSTAGWTPHVDDGFGDTKIALWVPLSDATVDNGCIYLVPRNKVTEDFSRKIQEATTFTSGEVIQLLHHAQALPASPGSLLGWGAEVIHWGSHSKAGAPPRISVAVEFVRRDCPETGTYGLSSMEVAEGSPSFETRLLLIAKNLIQYQSYEPRVSRYKELAALLAKRLEASGH